MVDRDGRHINFDPPGVYDPPEDKEDLCPQCGAQMESIDCPRCENSGMLDSGGDCPDCGGFGNLLVCENEPHTPEIMDKFRARLQAEADGDAKAEAEADDALQAMLSYRNEGVPGPRGMLDGSDLPGWMEQVMDDIVELGIGPEG